MAARSAEGLGGGTAGRRQASPRRMGGCRYGAERVGRAPQRKNRLEHETVDRAHVPAVAGPVPLRRAGSRGGALFRTISRGSSSGIAPENQFVAAESNVAAFHFCESEAAALVKLEQLIHGGHLVGI